MEQLLTDNQLGWQCLELFVLVDESKWDAHGCGISKGLFQSCINGRALAWASNTPLVHAGSSLKGRVADHASRGHGVELLVVVEVSGILHTVLVSVRTVYLPGSAEVRLDKAPNRPLLRPGSSF